MFILVKDGRQVFTMISDLNGRGIFSAFADLSEKVQSSHKTHLYQHFQIRHYVQNHFHDFPKHWGTLGLGLVMGGTLGIHQAKYKVH